MRSQPRQAPKASLSARLLAMPLLAVLAAGCDSGRMCDLKIDPPPPRQAPPVAFARPAYEPPVVPPALPPRPQPAPARTVVLGYSIKGKPIAMHVFGSGPCGVFIFGGIHGSEPGSAELAEELLKFLQVNCDVYRDTTIAVLPAANPDGLEAGTRTNAAGVDLNRNFPASNWRAIRSSSFSTGRAAASEPETAAIIAAMEMLKPNRIISIHAASPGRHCNNYDGPAEALAHLMAACNKYPAKASIGYPTPGSFGTWAGIDANIPTITLELPHDLRGEATWQANRQALLAAIRAEVVATGK